MCPWRSIVDNVYVRQLRWYSVGRVHRVPIRVRCMHTVAVLDRIYVHMR